MPTVILLDVSLSMSRPVAMPETTEEFQRRHLAIHGINAFLDYCATHTKLEFISLVSIVSTKKYLSPSGYLLLQKLLGPRCSKIQELQLLFYLLFLISVFLNKCSSYGVRARVKIKGSLYLGLEYLSQSRAFLLPFFFINLSQCQSSHVRPCKVTQVGR